MIGKTILIKKLNILWVELIMNESIQFGIIIVWSWEFYLDWKINSFFIWKSHKLLSRLFLKSQKKIK